MKFPIFFSDGPFTDHAVLNEETSKHVAGVLRMSEGDTIGITDGKGTLYTAALTSVHKKKTGVSITGKELHQQRQAPHTIAISLLKNSGRFEWFLEKATELGISRIIPLICDRTEKQGFRFDRMKQICISAMLQSQQVFMPDLHQPVAYDKFFERNFEARKYIAHCFPDDAKLKLSQVNRTQPVIFLIGPEGDFTTSEITLAKDHQYLPVSLGSTRLRTETAALAGALWLTIE